MDRKLLEILVCPICKGPLQFRREQSELLCRGCRLAYPVRDDIPVMLEDEARSVPSDELDGVSFTVVIPARHASTRLPGKPLLDIAGKPMLQHVWERAGDSGAERVLIATDDERVAAAARAFGAEVCMTGAGHQSGTERLAEVADSLGEPDERVYVNVQGDEPLLPPALVRQAADNLLAHADADIATLATRIDDAHTLFDPAAVKVVCDARGYALYFSRAPVPWFRDGFADGGRRLPDGAHYLRHIGLYAYRVGYLRAHAGLLVGLAERAESLEQLRALHAGRRIHVAEAVQPPGPGVDTPGDLERVRALFSGGRARRH